MNFALSADQTVLTLEIHEDVENLTLQFAASSLDQRGRGRSGLAGCAGSVPNHNAARKKRQPLTGDWFLGGEMYGSWRSSSRPFL
jgi:hypothetical protein